MNADSIAIEYLITLPNGVAECFQLELDAKTLLMKHKEDQALPPWTELGFKQCPHCPLKKEAQPNCPPAVNLVSVVKGFEKLCSFEKVEVKVTTMERVVVHQATVEKAVGSLMGLLMATSACPHLSFFRPMARFHLPFASWQETIFRATSSYLLAQYVWELSGEKATYNLEGLAEVYEQVQTVNRAFAERLRQASKVDSAVNALVLLDILAQTVPFAIDTILDDVRYVFAPFFDDFLSKKRDAE